MSEKVEKKLGYDFDVFVRNVSKNIPSKKLFLSFSLGKDSIASFYRLQEIGFDCELVYFYIVPELSFVEESIVYAENKLGKKIYKIPHPGFWKMIDQGVFQTPENISIINQHNPPIYDYEAGFQAINEDYKTGIEENFWTAVGTRATDSIVRWTSIKRYGPIRLKNRKIFPIYDLTKQETLKKVSDYGYRLPIDYSIFGLTWDGPHNKFLKPIKENFPQDYEKIKLYFPLCELDILRWETYFQNNKNNKVINGL